jgi:hypothetical protein
VVAAAAMFVPGLILVLCAIALIGMLIAGIVKAVSTAGIITFTVYISCLIGGMILWFKLHSQIPPYAALNTYVWILSAYLFVCVGLSVLICAMSSCNLLQLALMIVALAPLNFALIKVGRFVPFDVVRDLLVGGMPDASEFPVVSNHLRSQELKVAGPPAFRGAISKILDELYDRNPTALDEVPKRMPAIVYDKAHGYAGSPAGYFGLNGQDHASLRFTLLHQLGHNIYGDSEYWANRYAQWVLRKMKVAKYERKVRCPKSVNDTVYFSRPNL